MAGGWASLGLLPELVQTIEDEFHWTLPTSIQDEAIPLILGGGDVMASAETGSGKTAAFALPILQLCAEFKERQTSTKQTTASVFDNDDPGGKNKNKHNNIVMSLQDRDTSIAIDPNSNGLRIQSRDLSKWAGCRASWGISLKYPGKYTYQCKIMDDGLVRVGWSTSDASLQLGTDHDGYGYGGTGVKVHQNKYDPYPDERLAFGKGDTVGCHINILENDKDDKNNSDAAIISFSKNRENLGDAFHIKSKSLKAGDVFFPTVCLKNAECLLWFGGDNSSTSDYPLQPDYNAIGSLFDEKDDILIANPKDSAVVSDKSVSSKGPLAIVIEPTRDLAEQTYRAFADLASKLTQPSIQSCLLVGGINSKNTMQLLERNKVDVLVGTPPIITSNMKKGTIKAGRCRFFVLDEADELVQNSDTLQNIRSIYGRLLAASTGRSQFERLQVCFFSATLHSKEVRDLSDSICYRPLWIDLRGKDDSMLPETVHHCIIEIDPIEFNEKTASLLITDSVHRHGKLDEPVKFNGLSDKEINSEKVKQLKIRAVKDIVDKFSMDQVLVFCRTNLDCDLMEKFLKSATGEGGRLVDKYTCRVLAGMRSMEERQQSLKDFKDGEVRILIATDVAARGIDIRELPFVINCTLPDIAQTYVHRAGRVGRADRMGLCISLVATVEERVWFCKKGAKPPCANTSDFDKGGNCIWYKEPQYWKDIEKLLKDNNVIPSIMTYPEMELPTVIETVLQRGGYGDVVEIEQEPLPQMQSIQELVKQVEITESALQIDYWTLRNKFSKLKMSSTTATEATSSS